MRSLIHGGWVVGYQAGEQRLLREGEVVWEDDRIIFVGRDYPEAVDSRLDASGKLVSPGFVNVHATANIDIQTMMLDLPAAPFGKPESFVTARQSIAPANENSKTSAEFAIASLLKAGSTTSATVTAMALNCWESPHGEAEMLAESAGKLGARVYISHNYQAGVKYRDGDGITHYKWDEEAGQAGLENATRFIQSYHNSFGGRVQGMLFPYTVESCSPALLAATRAAARRLGVRIHTHAGEYLAEFHRMLAGQGQTPVGYLERAGLLGPDLIITHVVYTTAHPLSGFPVGDDSDLKRIAAHGTHVAHCPLVLARVGTALTSLSRYRQFGINVALGTDTFPPDMLEEMRLASLVNKIVDQNRAAGAAREVYHAATLGGARALGRDDLGRLSVGAKADLLVIDLDRLEQGPQDDPIQVLVHACNRRDIDTVIVDGRVVVEKGSLNSIDEPALLRQSRRVYGDMKQSIVEHFWPANTTEQIFPMSLPFWSTNP